MNGSPYIVGESSGFLNSSDVLVKAPGQKIQAQIHKQFIVKLIELVLKIKDEIALSIHTLDITSVIDIDSLALSPVFPPMAYFKKPKDVILDVKISSINFEFVGNSLAFKGYGSLTVSTEEKGTQSKILYMDVVSGISELIQLLQGSKLLLYLEPTRQVFEWILYLSIPSSHPSLTSKRGWSFHRH